jgi:hypothetical protein
VIHIPIGHDPTFYKRAGWRVALRHEEIAAVSDFSKKPSRVGGILNITAS